MPIDKAVDSTRLDGALTATANAIRAKTGDTASIQFDMDDGFSSAVAAISGGGNTIHIDTSVNYAEGVTWKENTQINMYNGSESSVQNYQASSFIDISAVDAFVAFFSYPSPSAAYNGGFYDENQNWLQYVTGYTVNPDRTGGAIPVISRPQNAKYYRFSLYATMPNYDF